MNISFHCRKIAALALAILLVVQSSAPAGAPIRTFCNPLNLDYGVRVKNDSAPHRHGADPVITLFNNRYYLFSTWDKPGYRVSDDLLTWKYIPFAEGVELASGTYTAAATMVIDGWLYFTEIGSKKQPVSLYRTREPDTGKWEKVRDLPVYRDPDLFIDPPSGRVFMYSGLGDPIHGVELDRTTFAEVPGTNSQLMPAIDPKARIENGWEVCTWDNSEASKPMRGTGTFLPCREGSWMSFLNGKYYLQFASPGTTIPGYSDGLLTGDTPLGPFVPSPYSPISRKDSGFVTSAGHGCLFQDRDGNWWRAVTMLIGAHERMERRIGLFPAGFDKDWIPYTRTELGDLPITMPQGKRDQAGDDVYAKWWLLSRGKPMTASSSLDGHPTNLADDEDIRSCWSAKTGNAGEWLQIDAGEEQDVRAVQINLAELDCDATKFMPDQHRFVLSASSDGQTWKKVVDRAQASDASPHTYVQFDEPVRARYFKLENVSMPGGGKFAVSDLRLFGVGSGKPPEPVKVLNATRDSQDRRKVALKWNKVPGASAYLIRYGITPDKLYQHHLINADDVAAITLYCLNNDPAYVFRVDAINAAGLTVGEATASTP